MDIFDNFEQHFTVKFPEHIKPNKEAEGVELGYIKVNER